MTTKLLYQRHHEIIEICNNKSNLTAVAKQVRANMQEKLSVHLHFKRLKCCKKSQILKIISHAALALTVSEILKFQIFYLEKVGQFH